MDGSGKQELWPAVFFDRDGVLIENVHCLHMVGQVKMLPGTVEALRLIRDAGYKVVVITNQSGVARGVMTCEQVEEIHCYMNNLLVGQKVRWDGIYYCPHHPTEGVNIEYSRVCNCRKPEIGMVMQAVSDLNIDLSRSWIVGDMTSDIQTGINAGIRTVLLETGWAGKDQLFENKPDFNAKNVLAAVRKILRE